MVRSNGDSSESDPSPVTSHNSRAGLSAPELAGCKPAKARVRFAIQSGEKMGCTIQPTSTEAIDPKPMSPREPGHDRRGRSIAARLGIHHKATQDRFGDKLAKVESRRITGRYPRDFGPRNFISPGGGVCAFAGFNWCYFTLVVGLTANSLRPLDCTVSFHALCFRQATAPPPRRRARIRGRNGPERHPVRGSPRRSKAHGVTARRSQRTGGATPS
jgi:hypothetical protein